MPFVQHCLSCEHVALLLSRSLSRSLALLQQTQHSPSLPRLPLIYPRLCVYVQGGGGGGR